MRVGFLGFGLIGGSIARALRDADDGWRMAAWSPSGSGPREACDEGVLDVAAGSPAEAIDGADVVVLAAPPLACLELLDALAGELRPVLRPDAIVTDVASTKEAICLRAERNGIRFVGGHPMAGREISGFAASDASLFRDRPWIVVPIGAADGDVAAVEQLATATGARPIRMDAASHDAATAAVSHLPLIVSAALAETVAASGSGDADWSAVAQLAASGWRDMTRLARGDVSMAVGIAATNAPAIARRLRAMRETLDAWLTELEGDAEPDAERLRARFAAARDLATMDRP